jgi:ABC-2 type transport system ATP-binding protein
LKEARERLGTTVILTTHDLGDIQELCRRILIIDKGRLLFDGLLEDLRRQLGDRVRVTLDLHAPAASSALANATDGLPVRWLAGDGQRHSVEFSRREVTAAEVIRRVVNAHRVHELSILEPSIEDVVRDIYRQGVVAVEEPAAVSGEAGRG